MTHEMLMLTPIGKLKVVEEENNIIELTLLEKNKLQDLNGKMQPVEAKMTDYGNGDTALLLMAKKQLDEYFAGKRKIFTLPLKPKGTTFQEKVWKALLDIPYGETRSYKEVAVQAGNGKACRAVGMSNNRNPIMILIPCHRVIGANGAMVGYGAGISVKEYLLNLEQG